MDKLLRGIKRFKEGTYENKRELYKRLADEGQHPEKLFITCSDSRVSPTTITSAEPGELFVLRNPGNIVPPYGAGDSGTESTIEYAVHQLGVEHIVVCGHTHCGAMTGLMQPEKLEDLPRTRKWLEHAERTRQIVEHHCADMVESDRINAAIQQNILDQLDNLRTHPCVAKSISTGQLQLHAMVFHIGSGEVYAYSPEEGRFIEVNQADAPPRLKFLTSQKHG
jgi:carbonic anhydrase